MNISAAFAHLENFHRANGTEFVYRAPVKGERSRDGTLLADENPKGCKVSVLLDWRPTPEEVTAFGNPADFSAGQRAIFRVLNSEIKPDVKASFNRDGKSYSILAVIPLERGGQVFKHDCLVGYE